MAEQTVSTVKLVSADVLEIELSEIPTSGYLWQLAEGEKAAVVIAQSFEESTKDKLLGANGKRIFKLKMLRPPPFTLRFIKKRPWETTIVEEHLVGVPGQ